MSGCQARRVSDAPEVSLVIPVLDGTPFIARTLDSLAAWFCLGFSDVINPGCGACIGCGPGVSERPDQVTVSAINRNFQGRSGPGKLWLASPLTVAASAIEGRIVSYTPGMFARRTATHPAPIG